MRSITSGPGGSTKRETLHHEPPAKWSVLLWRGPLLVLAVSMALFHFANAPLVPLLGQKLALAHPAEATLLLSACIITAQLVSIPTALLVGARADRWGRKPLLLVAFAALPLRGLLYIVSDHAGVADRRAAPGRD